MTLFFFSFAKINLDQKPPFENTKFLLDIYSYFASNPITVLLKILGGGTDTRAVPHLKFGGVPTVPPTCKSPPMLNCQFSLKTIIQL